MVDDANEPCLVIGGGGAVKFLLEAEEVSGYDIKPARLPFPDREHKDLDLIVLRKNKGLRRLRLPHEIFYMFQRGTLCQYDYRTPQIYYNAFHVEFTDRTYNFGGGISVARSDVIPIRIGRHTLWVLSPEFILVSRLFDFRPPRDGIDTADICLLKFRFPILDEEKIQSYLPKTPFQYLKRNEVEALLASTIPPEQYETLIQALIDREISIRFPQFLDKDLLMNVPPHVRRAFLLFSGEEFQKPILLSLRKEIDHVLPSLCEKRQPFYDYWLWSLVFSQYHLLENNRESLLKVFDHAYSQATDDSGVCLMQFSALFCSYLFRLKLVLRMHEKEDLWLVLVPDLVRKFYKTEFKHVFLANLLGHIFVISTAATFEVSIMVTEMMRGCLQRNWHLLATKAQDREKREEVRHE
jgi:hypothetical protein